MKNFKAIAGILLSGLFLLSFTNISLRKTFDDGLTIGQIAPMSTLEMANVDNSMQTLEILKMKHGLLFVF